jgi:hypothetical protein
MATFVHRAAKQKTLFIIMRKIPGGGQGTLGLQISWRGLFA